MPKWNTTKLLLYLHHDYGIVIVTHRCRSQGVITMQIANVNTENGIARSGGMKDIYLEILESFLEDGNERKTDLKQSLESENLSSYEIHAHGIKSALYIIGADEMSQTASDLEMAAKRGDIEFIKANNDTFVESLSTLVEDVQQFLEKQ